MRRTLGSILAVFPVWMVIAPVLCCCVGLTAPAQPATCCPTEQAVPACDAVRENCPRCVEADALQLATPPAGAQAPTPDGHLLHPSVRTYADVWTHPVLTLPNVSPHDTRPVPPVTLLSLGCMRTT